MNVQVGLATRSGLYFCQKSGSNWKIVSHSLKNYYVSSLMAREGVIMAGTQNGLFRSSDFAQSWEPLTNGLTLPHIRWLAYHPDISDFEFAGTEPAGIFISRDGGDSWEECPEVARLRDRLGWWLPYSPEAGCVRGFAIHGDRAFAAVEVGGLLRSDDGGRTWALAPGSSGQPDFRTPPNGYIHADVHSVEVHPGSPELVMAPTNSGTYRSEDGGSTWSVIHNKGYTRACWLDPHNPAHLITGPARGVDRDGTILETHDGGANWTEITQGLNCPWPRAMVDRFTQIGDELFAVISNGELYTPHPSMVFIGRRYCRRSTG
jgi:photosystem II stability/assembly factor-like uncharacterized protein